MNKSKKTIRLLMISIIAFALIMVVSQFRERNPYESYQHIKLENILDNPDDTSYYIYFYKIGCPYCEEVEDQVKEYARSHSTMYFVNMSENSDYFTKFDWNKFHEENDIEIGTVENNKIKYYKGESKAKYLNNQEKNEYGKEKKYEIIKADDDYLESNKKAKKGYVYASLQMPNIDYASVTKTKDIIIAGAPTLLHIENGKIDKFYFDSIEIGPLMDKLNC